MSFPALTLLDSFIREENPLSNGGKWKGFYPTGGESLYTGKCNKNEWETNSLNFEGAYWSPVEFANPAVSTQINRQPEENAGNYFTWWACLRNPLTSEISGYRLKAYWESGRKFEFKLEKIVKNVYTVLATLKEVVLEGVQVEASPKDKVGLTVFEGKVTAWRKKVGGEWVELLSALDATYTKGYVAFGGLLQLGAQINFEAGSAASPPTIENPGKQNSVLHKTVSLQIHASNVTKYFATGLPTKLSISETTGLITGETEVEESALVKIKVENVVKETAETSFEWNVTSKPNNVISMVLG